MSTAAAAAAMQCLMEVDAATAAAVFADMSTEAAAALVAAPKGSGEGGGGDTSLGMQLLGLCDSSVAAGILLVRLVPKNEG
eukprot:1051814-Prorocentrum_minimum.AAC.2